MDDDIKLPPLPSLWIVPSVEAVDHPGVAQALMDYAREAVRLNRCESRASTHAEGCWDWGPGHYGCAVRTIERLREQLRLATVDQATAEAETNDARAENEALQKDAERYRWLRDPCNGAERVVFYSRGDYGRGLMSSTMLDAAIDDAMNKESNNDQIQKEAR